MKKTFIKNKKLIIGFLLLFVPLMVISLYRIDYSLTAPGCNDDISTFIIIEDGSISSSSFHTTSVIVLDKISIIQYLIGSLEETVSVRAFPDYYENVDLDDLDVMSYLMKDDSLFTSLVVGINNSGHDIEYDTYLTVYLTYSYLSANSLQIGDKILEINGSTDFQAAIDDFECEDIVEFKIIRDNEELIVYATNNLHDNGTCTIGINLAYYTELIDTDVNYEIIETNTGGPSGGLMQALFVYNELIETDLVENLRIAGTGTINVDGSVGPIGGIKQKVITASLNNIDIFFVPYLSDSHNDNYIQALEVYNTLDTEMILVGVSSFQDAVDYLRNYENGDANE